MGWLSVLGRRLWMLMRGRQFDADLEEEMRLHLQLREQDHMQAGLGPTEARQTTLHRFGNEMLLKERSHMAWGWEWLEHLLQDVSYGVRAMLRSPGITIVALLSLALGIGANTAIFSLIDAVMLRSLPVKEPARLVLFGDGSDCCVSDYFPNRILYSYPFYREMQKKNQVFSDFAAVFSMMGRVHGAVEGRAESEPMNVQLVSGNYFSTLGVQAIVGRVLMDADDQTRDGNPVAVASHRWWTRSLAHDPSVLKKKIRIGSTIFTIVGVASPEFFGTKVGDAPDLWVPLSMQKDLPPYFDGYNDTSIESLYLIGRLKPAVSMTQASANANLLYQQILRGFPGASLSQENLEKLKNTRIDLTPMATGLSDLRTHFSESLKILMAIVGLVLLIACANIANLLLARSTARVRELAVRQALGAGRSRLIRQLLTESLVLALGGGALGVVLKPGVSRLLLRLVSSGGPEPLALDASMDIRVLLFTLGVTVVTGLLFGVIPAFRATKLELPESLKEGRGTLAIRARNPLAKALVVSQVAFSLVLLVAAGLFLHSLINLTRVETGFNREHVLRLQTDATSAGYKEDDPRLPRLYQQIEERVRSLPGVQSASYSLFTFNEGSWNNPVSVQGYVSADSRRDVHHNIVGRDYFATMGIPLLMGRGFRPLDTATSPKVAVISQTMARLMFPPGSPIGHHYSRGSDDIEVIGVVKDVKVNSLQEDPQPVDFYPYVQHVRHLDDFEVRYAGDLDAVVSAVRVAIHEVDPELPISGVTTLDEQVGRSIADQRLVAQLSTFFGLLAVFLSCIGIYGVMTYVVTRRTNEIGIRMALGAEPSSVLWMILREILILAASGVVIGGPVALAGERLVSNMLFGLRPTDPITLATATVALLLVAATAGYLPARRASMVDPMVAVRYE